MYYALADRLPAMYAAVALDPETKLQYFQIEWKDHPEWIETAEKLARGLWTTQYRTISYTDTTVTNMPIATAEFAVPEDATVISKWKQKKRAKLNTTEGDQFDRFQFTEEEEEVPDILRYWADRLSTPRWSQLAHMALEIHSIPAMSAEVERVFSRYAHYMFLLCESLKINI